MPLGDSSNIGTLGDTPFGACPVDLGILLNLHGITVAATRRPPATDQSATDIYGQPVAAAPAPLTVSLLLAQQELRTEQTPAGERRREVLTFTGQPGTLLENDVVAYGFHNYDVRTVKKDTVGGADVAESYTAWREVDQ